jgi:hypothetical protein
MRKLKGAHRHDILQMFDGNDLVGIELGVAAGEFSARMVASGRFAEFFGVDMYGDTHDTAQYKTALRRVGLFEPYKLLRMSFDEAYDLFDDESLDFIYIDGYAHSGQEGGDTIWKWARKVKIGGLIAGDDYHDDWPLVKEAVDRFLDHTGFDGAMTTEVEPDINYAAHPTWGAIKTAPVAGDTPPDLLERGKAAASKVAVKRAAGQKAGNLLNKIVGDARYERLRVWNRERKARRKD